MIRAWLESVGANHLTLPASAQQSRRIGALWRCVDRALETGTVLHLWPHPLCDPINVDTVFPAVLEYVETRRIDPWVTTMAGWVEDIR